MKMPKTLHKFNKTSLLPICLLVLVCGYTFFFSSSYWLRTSTKYIETTKLYQKLDRNANEITLYRWDYSKSQHLMEIDIDAETKSGDPTDYTFEATDRSNGKLKISTIANEEDMIVLQLYNVPDDWTEVSLKVKAPKTDANGKEKGTETITKLYTNKKSVNQVSSITKKTNVECRIERLESTTTMYKGLIKQETVTFKTLNKKVAEYEKKIDNLKETLDYQTEEQKSEADAEINSLKMQINTIQKSIDENKNKITEYHNRINKIAIEIEDLKGKGGTQ